MKKTIIFLTFLFLLNTVKAVEAVKYDDYLVEEHEHEMEEGEEGVVPDLEMARRRFELFKDHTKKYYAIINSDIEGLNAIIHNLDRKEDAERLVELRNVLSDYNSFLDDLSLMLGILNMEHLIREDRLEEYYQLQVGNHEKIKAGFSARNETYLNRIDAFKDQQARSYEKALLKNFREYCIFDITRLLTLEGVIEHEKD